MADLDITLRGTVATRTVVAASNAVTSAAAAVGDYLLVIAGTNYQSGLSIASPPAGVDAWTSCAASNSGNTIRYAAWLARVTSAGAKTATVTAPGSSSNIDVAVAVLNPSSGTITLDGAPTVMTDGSSPFTHAAVTVSGTKSFLVCGHTQVQFAGTTQYGAAPAGMTQLAAIYQNSAAGLQACYQSLTAAGNTGSRSQTSTPATVDGAGAMFALRSQGATTEPPAGGSLVEDFEDATYVTPISGDWFRTTTRKHSGSWSLRSADVSDLQNSDATLTVPPGATQVQFWYLTSSEANYDGIEFFIDSTMVFHEDQGDAVWRQSAVHDITGASTIRFRYIKDVSASAGDDAAYVDDLTFTVPAVTSVQASAAMTGGLTATVGGAVTPAVRASAAVAGGLAVTAGATTNTDVKAAAAVSGTLAVAAGARQTSRVVAAVTGALTVDAGPTTTYRAATAVEGLLSFAVAAVPARAATAVLTGALTVSLSPSRGQPVAAAVDATLAFTAVPGLAATAAVTAALDVSLAGKLDQAVGLDGPVGELHVDAGFTSHGYAAAVEPIVGVLEMSTNPFRDRRDAAAAVTGELQIGGAGVRAVTPTAAVAAALDFGIGTVIRAAAPILAISAHLRVEAIAVSSAGGALNVKLFAIDREGGGALVPLPHWSKLDVSRQVNGAGSVAVEYPVWGRNFWLLQRDVGKDSDLEVEVWLGGRRSTRVVGYLQQANGDDVAEGATWQFTGVDMCARTDEIIIYPQAVVGVADLGDEVAVPQSTVTTPQWTQLLSLGYTGRDGDTAPTVYVPQLVLNAVKAGTTIPVKADDLRELKFNATSPGAMMNIVMSQARARGTATDLTMDFTAARDSNGTPWPNTVTAKWSPGTTATSVLARLVDLGLIDWEITSNKVLRMFVQGTSGSLYTSGQSAVRLRRGVNLAQATHRASAREGATAVLAAGSGGLYSDSSNTSAAARRGRRIETYTTAGNIVDTDALLNVAQRTASLGANGPDERTFAIAMGTGNPRPGPGQTFDKADTLLLDTTGTGAWITARVAQWAISVDPAGASGNVVVGDLISSRAAAILRRLTDTGEGSTVVGTSLPSGPDTGIPQAPDGLVVGSYAFAGGSSGADEYATVTAGWQAVVYNTDNTACADLAGYRVEWRQDGTTAWLFGADVPAGSTQGSWTTACAIPIYVRVRAYDTSGNSSVWTTLPAPHTTDDDTTPPGIPSTPIGGNYLGTVQVTWDGRDSDNADMYAAWPDFKVAYLHMSQASEFVPDDSTQIDLLYGAGTYTYAKLPNGGSLSYGTTYYFKLVAEDQRENRSLPSGQTEAVPGKLLGDDIFAKAVGSAALGDLVVKTANIDNGAVNDLKVSDLSVGKLTAGTLRASMIVGTGKIASGTSGARWEGDSAGLRLYNAAGVLNVNLQTANGYALIAGEYRTTNASTARMVINPGGGAPDEMRFYPATTNQYAKLTTVTSGSTNFPNQAGAILKAYSPRGDGYAGKLETFPWYASLGFGSEMGTDSVVQTSESQVDVQAPRIHLGATPGPSDDGIIRLGQHNDATGDFYSATVLEITAGDGNGNAWLRSFTNNCGIRFNIAPDRMGILSCQQTSGQLCDIQARGVGIGSSRQSKRRIEDIAVDVLATVRGARGRSYEFDDLPGRKHIGLIAEELPEPLRVDMPDQAGPGVDLYALVTTVWEGLRQLSDQVEAMKKGRP